VHLVAAAAVSLGGVPARWHAPAWWLPAALCIHAHEGAWTAVGYVNGVPTYGGGMQMLPSTWARAGGGSLSVYDIAKRSPREQLYRAWIIYVLDGRSWREWGTARACGLR
jgi:Transglycosylase-like domain